MVYYISYNNVDGKILGFFTKKPISGSSISVSRVEWKKAQRYSHILIEESGSISYKIKENQIGVFKAKFLAVDNARYKAYISGVDPLLNEARIKTLQGDLGMAAECEERALQLRLKIQEAHPYPIQAVLETPVEEDVAIVEEGIVSDDAHVGEVEETAKEERGVTCQK